MTSQAPEEAAPEQGERVPPDESAREPNDGPAAAAETVAAAEREEAQHAPGDLDIPDGVTTIRGSSGAPRPVAIVVGRFNGAFTTRLLARALESLDEAGVGRDLVTVMPVPGAFELPLAAMALAKTRRFACVVALGCVIRGETAHFDFIAGEAASGLQLAALETGVPVSFGVLTVENAEQAEARIEKAAEAVRSALEMADVFAQLRAIATAAG